MSNVGQTTGCHRCLWLRLSNIAVERTAASHSLAAAVQRRRSAQMPTLVEGIIETLLPIAALVSLFAAIAIAQAEPVSSVADGRSGALSFAPLRPTGRPSSCGEATRRRARVVVGDLALPPNAAGRVPAMVIAHGSGGVLPGREDA